MSNVSMSASTEAYYRNAGMDSNAAKLDDGAFDSRQAWADICAITGCDPLLSTVNRTRVYDYLSKLTVGAEAVSEWSE